MVRQDKTDDRATEQNGNQPERTVPLKLPTLKRISRRSRKGEDSADEVVTRLLDESAKHVTLEEIGDQIQRKFDHLASIDVSHVATHKSPSELIFWVYSGEAKGVEDVQQLYDSATLATIERQDRADMQIPFTIIATIDGPHAVDQPERTTVHMADTVVGAKSIDLDDGLEYLKEKLARPDDWVSSQDTIIDSVEVEADS